MSWGFDRLFLLLASDCSLVVSEDYACLIEASRNRRRPFAWVSASKRREVRPHLVSRGWIKRPWTRVGRKIDSSKDRCEGGGFKILGKKQRLNCHQPSYIHSSRHKIPGAFIRVIAKRIEALDLRVYVSNVCVGDPERILIGDTRR